MTDGSDYTEFNANDRKNFSKPNALGRLQTAVPEMK